MSTWILQRRSEAVAELVEIVVVDDAVVVEIENGVVARIGGVGKPQHPAAAAALARVGAFDVSKLLLRGWPAIERATAATLPAVEPLP